MYPQAGATACIHPGIVVHSFAGTPAFIVGESYCSSTLNPMQAGSGSLQSIQPQGCTPLRPSYVADLRFHSLKGNTTLAPADNNTTRKAGPGRWRLRTACLPLHGPMCF